MDRTPCRGCKQMIDWAITAKNRKPIPLEIDNQRGNVLVDADGLAHVFRDHPHAMSARERPQFNGASFDYFLSHHATCPAAGQFRRR